MNRSRTYKGHIIDECERVKGEHSGKWRVRTYHHTGTAIAKALGQEVAS